ncbi:hypothetical protein Gogos_019836, partial [Gossypium gossypioides]|nr:hypothetical protein [Gossypium gossypioides]
WASEGEIFGNFSGYNISSNLRVLLFKVRGLGLMRLVRGMQRLFRDEVNVLGSKKSFSQGIGVTVPKARTRDKPMS